MIRITKLYGRNHWYFNYSDIMAPTLIRTSMTFKSVTQLMKVLNKIKQQMPRIIGMFCEVDIGEEDVMFELDHDNDAEVLAFILKYS